MGVSGSPMWVSEVMVQNSARDVLCEVGCCAGVPWRSPPIRMGRSGWVSKRSCLSHVSMSWYSWLPVVVEVCGK